MPTTFRPQDVHIPEQGQTVIELTHPYVVGAAELIVYLNGILAVVNEDYNEIDNLHIEFTFQLSSDDVVITQHLVMFTDKLVKIFADKGTSLFHRYGDKITLKNNQRYQVSFTYGDKELTSQFFTPVSPMYVPVQMIRADLGKFIEKITDFQITFLIFYNSMYASTLFDDFFDIDEDSGLGTLNTTNGVVPFKVKQFVRYRTEVDLITQIYLSLMGQSGSDHMVLGQLEIEKRFNLGDYKPLLDSIKAELTKYSRTKSPLRTAVKGGSSAYTLTSPRSDFTDVFTSGGG